MEGGKETGRYPAAAVTVEGAGSHGMQMFSRYCKTQGMLEPSAMRTP